MVMVQSFVFLVILSMLHVSQGFLQEFMPKTIKPQQLVDLLKPVSEALIGQELEVRLEVGETNIMNIQQLLLQLDGTSILDLQSAPNAITTTGKSNTADVRSVQVKKPGSFISLKGQEQIHLDYKTGVWELLWNSPSSPAGALVIGIDVLDEAVRNQAKLPKGHLYLSFPVWTKDGIAKYQERKRECEEAAAVHLHERDVQLQKMQETNNWFAKVVHYRNAAAAVERYSLYPMRSMSKVPEQEDLIPLRNGLFLTKTGTIYKHGVGHAFAGGSPIHQGFASIKVSDKVKPTLSPALAP